MMKGDCEMSYGKCVRILGLVVAMAATGLVHWLGVRCMQPELQKRDLYLVAKFPGSHKLALPEIW